MKRTLNTLAILAVACASQAMSFSSVSIVDPLSNGSDTNADWGSFGPNGLEFSLPGMNALLMGTVKKLEISFRVDATAGYQLDDVTVDVIGSLRHATSTVKATHTPGPQVLTLTQSEVAGNVDQISGGGMAFSPPESFFDVFVEISLENHFRNPPFAEVPFSKLTTFVIYYGESVVPEPASIAAIGIGMASLMFRSKKRR